MVSFVSDPEIRVFKSVPLSVTAGVLKVPEIVVVLPEKDWFVNFVSLPEIRVFKSVPLRVMAGVLRVPEIVVVDPEKD